MRSQDPILGLRTPNMGFQGQIPRSRSERPLRPQISPVSPCTREYTDLGGVLWVCTKGSEPCRTRSEPF